MSSPTSPGQIVMTSTYSNGITTTGPTARFGSGPADRIGVVIHGSTIGEELFPVAELVVVPNYAPTGPGQGVITTNGMRGITTSKPAPFRHAASELHIGVIGAR